MSVYNRKLFFNRGGQVKARGTGITSGLTQPVQKFQKGGTVIDPMAKARAAFYSGLMSGRSRNAKHLANTWIVRVLFIVGMLIFLGIFFFS